MKRNNKPKNLVWERGYRCHTLWDGKVCVGRVSLWETPERRGIYLCEAGTLKHDAASLDEAKQWVRENVVLSELQGTLF